MSNGSKLVYDIQSRPNRVYFEESGKAPQLIYKGLLSKIQVTNVNGATPPEHLEFDLVSKPVASFFTTAAGRSVLALPNGHVFDFRNTEFKAMSVAPLFGPTVGLVSWKSSSGQEQTLFYDGTGIYPFNDSYYSGTVSIQEKKLYWGGTIVATRDSRGGIYNLPPKDFPQIRKDFQRKPYLAGPLNEKERPGAGATIHPVDELAEAIETEVIDQDPVVEAYVDTWKKISKPHARRKVGVVAVLGPTGAGKTFSAQKFSEMALNDANRFLEIDASAFARSEDLYSIFGAPNGILSTDVTKGRLIDFINGPGKGKSVIVFNEIEKASPAFYQRIMEMIDTGKIQAGDGNTYDLGRCLFVFTSNKGSAQIYPRGKGRALSQKEIEQRRSRFDSETLKELFIQPDPSMGFDERKRMPPEVANRIDRYAVAMPVSDEGALTIAENELVKILKGVALDDGYAIDFDHEALKQFVQTRYMPENGTRPLVNDLDALIYKITQVIRAQPPQSGEVVKVRYIAPEEDQPAFFEIQSGESKQLLPAPKPPKLVDNPLTDPDARYKLLNMESKLKRTVFGQDKAIETVATAIRSKALNTMTGRPAVATLLGPTGTGKTEIGRAVASELFGDRRRLLRLDMGEVKDEAHFNNLFGSPKGTEGSTTLSPFEQFLIDYPEGGVIMFDEIGNMGTSTEAKTALLMKFYAMLEEGEWRSPQGKVYDLRKYFILFTSNEGDEIYRGLPSDDLRMAAWEESRGKQAVSKMLKEHGWPEPLIARMQGNLVSMKPLLESEREFIAQKLVTTVLDQIAAQHPLTKFEVEPDFYKKAAVSFFSHTQGARNIRDVAEGALTDLIGKVVMDNYGSRDLRHSTLHLELTDNYLGRTSYKGEVPPKRQVELVATLRGPNGAKTYEADLIDDAALKRLHSEFEMRIATIHEAGHGVVNEPSKTGEEWDFVTVQGEGEYGGYARYKRIGSKTFHTREDAIARIARMLAGGEAERIMGIPQNSGWSQDLQDARTFAKKAVTEWGLSPRPYELVNDPKTEREAEELIAEGQALAEKKLHENWSLVLKVAEKLQAQGHLNRAEIDALTADRQHQGLTPVERCMADKLTAL